MTNYDALFTVGCIVGVFAIFYGPWQGFCIESARQIIFEQREKLFDMAVDGRLDFNSTPYRELRDFLNKSIRFSHSMTIWQFLLNRWTLSRLNYPGPGAINALLTSIEDVEVRKAATSIIASSSNALVGAMGLRSAPILFACATVWVVQRLGIRTGFRTKLRSLEREVQREVEIVPAV